MMFCLATILAAPTTTTMVEQPTADVDLARYTFTDYVRDFKKSYDADHFPARQAAFESAMEKIVAHNAAVGTSWKMGVSEHTDKLPSEWRQITTGRNAALAAHLESAAPPAIEQAPVFSPASLPASVDWRTKNAVTPVKNQGGCGSCWAFSATESIESSVFMTTGKLPVLAPQELVDCVENPKHCGGTGGCEGATQPLGFAYAEKNGMAASSTYPYTGHDGKCSYTKSDEVAGIKSYVRLPTNNYTALMHAVATIGPVAISVDAEPWSFYSHGVFDGAGAFSKTCGTTIDHAVQLVGYGTDDQSGKDYWLVRNSWGAGWGEKGYIRIERFGEGNEPCGEDKRPGDGTACEPLPKEIKVCGMCGILSDSSYPTGGFLKQRGDAP
jgi:cathepsin L